ncbi:hypothetical protein Leryth_010523 [Lithospermum erythrorhizon]|nr:hypothetical protein Leryth_010523 [Lithospermum erythrorhizon]
MSLFQLMCQIASTYKEEYVRQEAVSIMSIIVIRSNPYSDREKFMSEELFRSISELLRKEAGLGVQTQTLHVLYLLLTCPKILSWFCTTCKEEMERAGKQSDVGDNSISVSQGCHMIFEGLADCILCSGLGSQELRLRRNAIIQLAFLASSGTCGVEIMFGFGTAKKFLLLLIILRSLTSEIDLEAKEPAQSPEIFKERSLLMRETLILLNGLVSHPQYCGPVLRALTGPREMMCLTSSIVNSLSVKAKCPWKDDKITTQIRELEVLELARVFKKRIFAYLGYNVS